MAYGAAQAQSLRPAPRGVVASTLLKRFATSLLAEGVAHACGVRPDSDKPLAAAAAAAAAAIGQAADADMCVEGRRAVCDLSHALARPLRPATEVWRAPLDIIGTPTPATKGAGASGKVVGAKGAVARRNATEPEHSLPRPAGLECMLSRYRRRASWAQH